MCEIYSKFTGVFMTQLKILAFVCGDNFCKKSSIVDVQLGSQ